MSAMPEPREQLRLDLAWIAERLTAVTPPDMQAVTNFAEAAGRLTAVMTEAKAALEEVVRLRFAPDPERMAAFEVELLDLLADPEPWRRKVRAHDRYARMVARRNGRPHKPDRRRR